MNELNWIVQQAQCLYMLFAENDILNKCIYFFWSKTRYWRTTDMAHGLNIMFTWNVHLSKLYVIDHTLPYKMSKHMHNHAFKIMDNA